MTFLAEIVLSSYLNMWFPCSMLLVKTETADFEQLHNL